jgi:hypothetical protein
MATVAENEQCDSNPWAVDTKFQISGHKGVLGTNGTGPQYGYPRPRQIALA